MQSNVLILVFFSIICFAKVSKTLRFEDVTKDVIPSGEDAGIIAAFGHFNTDEFTDIVSLQKDGHKIQVLKGSEDEPYFMDAMNCSFSNMINSVVPGDYNGDSLLDLLVSLSVDLTHNNINMIWGKNDSFDCTLEHIFNTSKQPFIVDFDGDMLPDVIGEVEDIRYVWISSKDKKFKILNLNHTVDQVLKVPHSSGLVDLNNDLVPEMLITGKEYIETWFSDGNEYRKNDRIKIHYPPKVSYVHQLSFIDFNLNGQMEVLLPVCYDTKCTLSAILIWNPNHTEWETLLSNFRNPRDTVLWGFRITNMAMSPMEQAALLPTLRGGDIDTDGYPDFIVTLQSKKNAMDFKAVILKNVPCDHCYTGRSLEILWDVPGLTDIKYAQLAAFFDLYEDGVLDVLVSTKIKNDWRIHFLKNTEVFDSCFLKVLVLNGLCYHNCTMEPYGVNQPGPMVRYNMTRQNGSPVVSTSIQLSQSAYFSLQLPYSLFGLGPTPNFIDILTVSVPSKFNETVHKREWTQIIPNSQIVVIPYPPTEEKMWVKKLFVTPSHLVLLTCISLIGTCIFISLLVALLHWKERREDKIEKKNEAHRFHFDAM